MRAASGSWTAHPGVSCSSMTYARVCDRLRNVSSSVPIASTDQESACFHAEPPELRGELCVVGDAVEARPRSARRTPLRAGPTSGVRRL
jgi:hypothetical protein